MATTAMAAYVTTNQKMVYWDAVTMSADGKTPIPADQVSYNVWIANAITDPSHANPQNIVSSLKTPEYLISLNTEGRYDVGVSAVRTVGGVIVDNSPITWSNLKGTPTVWGLQFFAPIASPGTIRLNK